MKGLLFTDINPAASEYYPGNDLICFLQNDSVVLHYNSFYQDCFPSVLNNETVKLKFGIKAFPNPVNKNYLNFEWGNNPLETIELFDFSGRLIEKITVAGKTNLEYPIETLRPSIYFYRTNGTDRSVKTGKFIVQ
jgi:hypothetical protein